MPSCQKGGGLMRESKVYDCTVIELDKHHSDRKGNITVVENKEDIPFEVRRTYYLYEPWGTCTQGAEPINYCGKR